jgi:hypothetical protein
MTARTLVLALCAALALGKPVRAEMGPDILVLGDSQLSFGAGVAFTDTLLDMAGRCGLPAGSSVGVVGVRASSPQSWTATTRRGKWSICGKDPKWNANAGAYGALSPGKNPYVQIGRAAPFRFCGEGRAPLTAVFEEEGYTPKLLILFFLGNSAERWAGDMAAARADARALAATLPAGLPCVFMTTAPTYGSKVVKLRQRAQDNFAAALAAEGRRCAFVAGYTPETVAENEGNARNFRRKKSGAVRDPYHPTEAAARRFLSLREGALCQAVAGVMGGG